MSDARLHTVEVTLASERVVRVTGYTRLCYESYESFYLDDAELVITCAVDVATGAVIEDAATLQDVDDVAFELICERKRLDAERDKRYPRRGCCCSQTALEPDERCPAHGHSDPRFCPHCGLLVALAADSECKRCAWVREVAHSLQTRAQAETAEASYQTAVAKHPREAT